MAAELGDSKSYKENEMPPRSNDQESTCPDGKFKINYFVSDREIEILS